MKVFVSQSIIDQAPYNWDIQGKVSGLIANIQCYGNQTFAPEKQTSKQTNKDGRET